MKIRYALSEHDMVNYAYYRYWAAPDRLKYRLITRFGLPGIAIAVGIFLLSRDMLITGSIFIIAGLILMIFGPRFIKRKFRKDIEQMPDGEAKQNLLAEHESEISAAGLTDRVNGKEFLTTWDMMEKVSESHDFLSFHLKANTEIIIPRRAFSDEDGFIAFRKEAGSFISKN